MWELLSLLKEAKENHSEAFASNSFIYHLRMWFCISWSEKLPKFKKVLELTLLFLHNMAPHDLLRNYMIIKLDFSKPYKLAN